MFLIEKFGRFYRMKEPSVLVSWEASHYNHEYWSSLKWCSWMVVLVDWNNVIWFDRVVVWKLIFGINMWTGIGSVKGWWGQKIPWRLRILKVICKKCTRTCVTHLWVPSGTEWCECWDLLFFFCEQWQKFPQSLAQMFVLSFQIMRQV